MTRIVEIVAESIKALTKSNNTTVSNLDPIDDNVIKTLDPSFGPMLFTMAFIGGGEKYHLPRYHRHQRAALDQRSSNSID